VAIRKRSIAGSSFVLVLTCFIYVGAIPAQDKTASHDTQRVFEIQRFHQQASQKMGLLIPLYV
jgi:hypothetical protein